MKSKDKFFEKTLIINQPKYYTKEYGEIKEISEMIEKLSRKIDLFDYTFFMIYISITPIIVPQDMRDNVEYSEKSLVCLSKGIASISLQSDYEEYHSGDAEKKKRIIIDNVCKSLDIVKNKITDEFDCERLKKDVLKIAFSRSKSLDRK